ncbi:MAG: hypothetical protein HY341_02540, partial [Candidatus Kerfeldbacteria bacterium]|nr:hypothetical protein [Candidatus Kerfeldbacteria bacterium]
TGESCGTVVETGAGTAPPVEEPAPPEEEPGTTPPPAPPDEEEDKPACQVETGKVLLNDEYVCPTSSVEEGGGCLCIEGYEWVSPADHCQGCTKTNVEKCLAAVRTSIDQATGTLEPNLRVEDTRIIWDGGETSCKSQASVIADFSDLLRQYTPQNTAECTNLEFLAGYAHPALACGIEFSFRYAQE